MLLDADVIEEKREAATEDARKLMRSRVRLAIYMTAAVLIVSGAVVPFCYGHSLHAYWDSIGKYLVMLGMVLILVWGFAVRAAINAWALVCKLENEVQ
jgi:cell division septal protein FtsQ